MERGREGGGEGERERGRGRLPAYGEGATTPGPSHISSRYASNQPWNAYEFPWLEPWPMKENPVLYQSGHEFPLPVSYLVKVSSSSSLLYSSLDLNDIKDYEPEIRALLGTVSHFYEVGVPRLRTGIPHTYPRRSPDFQGIKSRCSKIGELVCWLLHER